MSRWHFKTYLLVNKASFVLVQKEMNSHTHLQPQNQMMCGNYVTFKHRFVVVMRSSWAVCLRAYLSQPQREGQRKYYCNSCNMARGRWADTHRKTLSAVTQTVSKKCYNDYYSHHTSNYGLFLWILLLNLVFWEFEKWCTKIKSEEKD